MPGGGGILMPLFFDPHFMVMDLVVKRTMSCNALLRCCLRPHTHLSQSRLQHPASCITRAQPGDPLHAPGAAGRREKRIVTV